MKPSWSEAAVLGLLLFFAMVMANGWPQGDWSFGWGAIGAIGTIAAVFSGFALNSYNQRKHEIKELSSLYEAFLWLSDKRGTINLECSYRERGSEVHLFSEGPGGLKRTVNRSKDFDWDKHQQTVKYLAGLNVDFLPYQLNIEIKALINTLELSVLSIDQATIWFNKKEYFSENRTITIGPPSRLDYVLAEIGAELRKAKSLIL